LHLATMHSPSPVMQVLLNQWQEVNEPSLFDLQLPKAADVEPLTHPYGQLCILYG
jgi:hypothetical protein